LDSEIYLADADGRNIRKLLGAKNSSFNNARVSPSGKWVAFLYSRSMLWLCHNWP
jgi:Tol biopolymer transport system component